MLSRAWVQGQQLYLLLQDCLYGVIGQTVVIDELHQLLWVHGLANNVLSIAKHTNSDLGGEEGEGEGRGGGGGGGEGRGGGIKH